MRLFRRQVSPRPTGRKNRSQFGVYVAFAVALTALVMPTRGPIHPAALSFPSAGESRRVIHVTVKAVHVARYGRWIAARAWIRNPSAYWWAPAARVRFSARDGQGNVVATYAARAVLRPDQTVSVIAPSFLLPSATSHLPHVTVRVWAPGWRWSTSYVAPRLHLEGIHVIRRHHRLVAVATVHNLNRANVAAIIGCTGRDRNLHLTGAAVGRVLVGPRTRTRVHVPIPHVGPGTVAGDCRVMGWNGAQRSP